MGEKVLHLRLKDRLEEENDHTSLPRTDAASGITSEDRAEILATIEEVSRTSRMSFTGKGERFSALHSGLRLPVLVNLLAVAVCASGLVVISRNSQAREKSASETVSALSSVEGRLIQRIKQDSEIALKAKEGAILDLRNRLEELDRKKMDLASYYQKQLKAKAEELRLALEQELERERSRLVAQGLSDYVIAQRLETLEKERKDQIQRELALFRSKLDSDRVLEEQKLAKMREDYQSELSALNDERKRIQSEAKQREDSLRASLEAKFKADTAAIESEAVLKARNELSLLEREKSDLARNEDQIVAIYEKLQGELSKREWLPAADTASSLRRLLNDPTITSLPVLAARRSADLFVADYIERNARLENERSLKDLSLLERQADILSRIQSLSQAGSKAISQGDAATAEARYTEALSLAPEILAAHRYLGDQTQAIEDRKLSAATKASLEALEALRRDDFPRAAASLSDALSASGVEPELRSSLVSGLTKVSSAASASAEREKVDSEAAAAPLLKARTLATQGNYPEALDIFIQTLGTYPAARQRPELLKGIESSIAALQDGMAESSARAMQERDETLAALEKSVASLTEANAALKAEMGAANTGENNASLSREKDERIAALERDLAASLEAVKAAEARSRSLGEGQSSGGPPLIADGNVAQVALVGAAAPPESQSEQKAEPLPEPLSEVPERAESTPGPVVVPLTDVQLALIARGEKLGELEKAFTSYAEAEDRTRASGGVGVELRARSNLDSFLDSPVGRMAMPGFRDRLSRYERELSRMSQSESLQNAASIAESALRLKDQGARERYLADLSSRYADDRDMSDFIGSLVKALK